MKKSYQFRALFFKNAALQSRQIGTNVCQMLTPLICLIFVKLIQEVAFDKFKGSSFTLDFPYLLNVPLLYSALPGIAKLDCLQWFYYDTQQLSEQDREFVGWNTGVGGHNMTHGLLSHVISRPGCNVQEGDIQNSMNVPYFMQPNKSIDQDIYEHMMYLNTVPFVRGEDLKNLYLIPDGAVTFHHANDRYLNYTLQINDFRLHEYHRGNGVTKVIFQNRANPEKNSSMMLVSEGQIALIDLMSRAYLNYLNPDVWLISGIQYMPLIGEDRSFLMKVVNVVGAMLYPLSLSLLLPVFLYAIVLEKEERLLQMMKMNGMRMNDYWLIQYIFCGLMTLLTFAVFFIVGYYVIGLQLFTMTSVWLWIITLAGWGLSQISLSFFFQVFISKARTSTIVGYLLSVWTSIVALTINLAIYPDPHTIPVYIQMVPQFAFARIIYVFSIQCSASACISEATNLSSELTGCIISLYLGFIIFGGLGIFLHEVVPQEFGVTSEPWIFSLFKRRRVELTDDDDYRGTVAEPEEDQDAVAERNRVYETRDYQQYPLVCRDLRKQYDAQVAVKNFSIRVEKGEIFGLLGPNGAGKTSIISTLTGLYPCTDGNAWVAGYEIRTQMREVQLRMGVCPQFDLLWPDLTVEEHLLFYARLKGVHRDLEKARTQQSMAEVRLEPYFNYQASQLSGGMKRRLSIAIALVGDPEIIFLDEPSTGLDPDNRRSLWDIIIQCRGRRAMVLTTHSMEEADVLCSRIGILSQGVLRCIGPSTRLKTLYGGGYHLFINSHRDKYLSNQSNPNNSLYYQQLTKEYLLRLLPQSTLISEFNGNFIYQVPLQGLVVSEVFAKIKSKEDELQIAEWGISQSTLEDVFMKIVELTK